MQFTVFNSREQFLPMYSVSLFNESSCKVVTYIVTKLVQVWNMNSKGNFGE